MACGVAHCHARRVVLRDLKPANILLEALPGDGDTMDVILRVRAAGAQCVCVCLWGGGGMHAHACGARLRGLQPALRGVNGLCMHTYMDVRLHA